MVAWNLGEVAQCNSLYERLCGTAATYMDPYRTRADITVEYRKDLLLTRFKKVRPASQIAQEIADIKRQKRESIVVFVVRLERLVDEFGQKAGLDEHYQSIHVWQEFIRHCTDSHLKERFEMQDYNHNDLHVAIQSAQKYYDLHHIGPWAWAKIEAEGKSDPPAVKAKNNNVHKTDSKPNSKPQYSMG